MPLRPRSKRFSRSWQTRGYSYSNAETASPSCLTWYLFCRLPPLGPTPSPRHSPLPQIRPRLLGVGRLGAGAMLASH